MVAGNDLPALALTMGEPAGIGGELTIKAWARRADGVPPFFAIDDPARLADIAAGLGIAVEIAELDEPGSVAATFAHALPVLPEPLAATVHAGTPSPETAINVRRAIERAVALVQEGTAAGVVTNPLQKEVMYAAGFDFPGHTEFLGALAGGVHPVMMLAGPSLRVVPVTVHVPLRDALQRLTTEAIVRDARIAHDELIRSFGIPRPRLAIAGLNPHAGEGGALGDDEARIITPAIESLRDAGIDVRGPVPPDALFTPRARAGYDAAICMYHDQALIPIKALDFDEAVNVTLGLPFVRTSPDHGTALDIAGKGIASETSLVAALRLAAELAGNRLSAAA